MSTTTRNPITGHPALCLYHPNAKGTGSAVCLTPQAATAENDGALVVAVAKQKTVADLGAEDPARRYATFDWTTAVRVRLDPLEVAELLAVVGGQSSVLSHAGKDGIFHNCPERTVSVEFKRSEDPCRPGFLLGMGETPKADPNARQYRTFAFWPAEALLLRHALVGYLPRLCFGE